jgi:glutaminase
MTISGREHGGAIGAFLKDLHARLQPLREGAVATYIPELGKADPSLFGLAIATTDGFVYAAGDADHAFTIQSVSKPFMYGHALETLGRAQVLTHVGVEPTGAAFNATVFDEVNNRPSNPMVNAGAIAVSSLTPGEGYAQRRAAVRALFSRYAGRALEFDESVFCSERETGERNRVIAALMRQAAMLQGDPEEILDLYFSQCSVLVTCRDLAIMAAALANGGVQPLTGERVLALDYVPDVLSVMHSCGMYNYAGQWSFEVGVPAKSGVAGAIIGVVPGQLALAVFSPPLDGVGNSVRGIAAFKEAALAFGLHSFKTPAIGGEVVRRELGGEVLHSKRRRTAKERAVLEARGGRIRLVEAQGALVFASAERLLRRLQEIECEHVIVDLRRVYAADEAALKLIEIALTRQRRLIFSEVTPPALKAMLVGAKAVIFADSDAAIEWCEDAIIAAEAAPAASHPFALAQVDLFRSLSKQEVRALERAARPFVFEAGQTMMKEGDAARLFFVIAQGRASVRLALKEGSARVASLGPGASVGEMALLDLGVRSADVIADERVVCYGFAIEDIRARGAELRAKILLNLSADMAERLRAANAEIRALKN